MTFFNLSFSRSPNRRNTYVSKLEQQVRWQSDHFVKAQIDQTRLSISDSPIGHSTPFSFVVIGDTDPGLTDLGTSAQAVFSEAFSQQLGKALNNSRFLLHTGDITYPSGTYENYFNGFLKPYRMLLSQLPVSAKYNPQSIVFRQPFLPVIGNHDCGRAHRSLWQRSWLFMCDRLRQLGIDLGHYGGDGGEAYGKLFLDDLAALSAVDIAKHLAAAYSAKCYTGFNSVHSEQHCLNYQPGAFTRLPNRYYQFHYSGIDFFALDSNSWNTSNQQENFDQAQLDWLENALVASHQNPNACGRIIYLHHSPYTTEELRWQQSDTLWVRRHLRSVLDRSQRRLAALDQHPQTPYASQNKRLVDLVISGHAHCLEYVKTVDTGHADSQLDWLVCGGSGVSLRRQRKAEGDILERLENKNGHSYTDVVAKSQMYVGRHSHKRTKQNLHTFVRIDVRPDCHRRLSIQPFVVSQDSEGWHTQSLSAIDVGGSYSVATSLR